MSNSRSPRAVRSITIGTRGMEWRDSTPVGDAPHNGRERSVAVVLVLAAASSLQVGAAFAITLFDELGPGGAAFLRLAFAAIVLCAIWRPSLQGDLRVAAAFG